MKNQLFPLVLFALLILACSTPRKTSEAAANPLLQILKAHPDYFGDILKDPDRYEVQIIYTQIDRDEQNVPHFTTWEFNVDSSRYFYPASMVKMPLAFLSLEKVNHLQSKYKHLNKYISYQLDSVREKQIRVLRDSSSNGYYASLAHDIKKIFTVSDNYSYNNLFDFLGREYLNKTLRDKGYTHTAIVHHFSIPGIDNRYTRPVNFFKGDILAYPQEEQFDPTTYVNPMKGLLKGKGYLDDNEQLVNKPFDFSRKNYSSLGDLTGILKAVIFPEATPAAARFDLTEDDYRFLYKWMSIFPRESDYPKFDPKEYYDGYCKYVLFGDTHEQQPGHIRVFDKVGEAYGYLTDVAYVVDFDKNVEFMLSATISCNDDGIFNDDKYNYEQLGLPFLGRLGRAVYDYDGQRTRKNKPDLSKFKCQYP